MNQDLIQRPGTQTCQGWPKDFQRKPCVYSRRGKVPIPSKTRQEEELSLEKLDGKAGAAWNRKRDPGRFVRLPSGSVSTSCVVCPP